jgi:hypothetical protein
MTMTSIEHRLRTALLLIAGWICLGTPIELLLSKHVKSPEQFIPFVLCALGLIAIVAALLRPRRPILIGLRATMGLLLIGSAIGIVQHLNANADFVFEMHPNAALNTIWLQIAQGAAPLLAPGILALAAILAILATYAHPALQSETAPAHVTIRSS